LVEEWFHLEEEAKINALLMMGYAIVQPPSRTFLRCNPAF
jgi:hypothetical protein